MENNSNEISIYLNFKTLPFQFSFSLMEIQIEISKQKRNLGLWKASAPYIKCLNRTLRQVKITLKTWKLTSKQSNFSESAFSYKNIFCP